MSDNDNHPLARAILAATDRKRLPWVYRPASALTPLRLALILERARKVLGR